MTDSADRFLQPSSPAPRRYEALRARFGYSYGSFRNLCSDFLRHPDRPLFPSPAPAPRPAPADDSRS